MLISIEHGLVFLSTPKCASTSIEMALQNHMDVVVRGPLKHTNYRRYERFCVPYLAQACKKNKLETVCLIREPIDWLESWYRYRRRDELKSPLKTVEGLISGAHEQPAVSARHANSTSNISFDDFVEGYISTERPAWAEVGSQYNFIRNRDGEIGVDRVFPYERLDLLVEYMGKKMGMELSIGTYNKSPEMEVTLRPDLRERLLQYFEQDYAAYAKALNEVAA